MDTSKLTLTYEIEDKKLELEINQLGTSTDVLEQVYYFMKGMTFHRDSVVGGFKNIVELLDNGDLD